MKPRARWIALLVGLGLVKAAIAQPRLLPVEVVGVDGESLEGVFLRLAGDEPDGRVHGGWVELQIPTDVLPGDDVLLLLEDPRWAFLEPEDGWLRVPRLGTGQVTRVVLLQRGKPERLERATIRRAFGRQLVKDLEERAGEPTEQARVTALSELSEKYGLEPEQIDQALKAWSREALGERDRRLLNRYLRYFPQTVESREGGIVFTGPVIIRDQPDYFLRSVLDSLDLGEPTVLKVGSAPEEAMVGSRCTWTFEPADFLEVIGDSERDCSLAVALPKHTVPRYSTRVSLDIEVRVSRGGAIQDVIQDSAEVSNGLALHAVLEGIPLTPDGQVLVTLSKLGEPSPLPEAYRCSWSPLRPPFRRIPVAANECVSRVELIPIEEWSSGETAAWMTSLPTLRGPSVVVTADLDGRPLPGGQAQFQIEVHEPRPRAVLSGHLNSQLRKEEEQRRTEKDRGQLERQIAALGLPPIDQISASDLRLAVDFSSSGWRLLVVYEGKEGESLIVTDKRSPLQVLLSPDGTDFSQRRGWSRDYHDLSQLDSYWVKLQATSLSTVKVGPFRLPMDGAGLLRRAVRRYWLELGEERRSKIACERLTGLGRSNAWEGFMLLPLLESVSVSRTEGTVERTQVYGADSALLAEPDFLLVPRPLAGVPFVVRLRWADAPAEDFECPADYGYGGPRNGFHYVLRRLAGQPGPPEIEIFLERDRQGKWRVQFERRFQPAFVRYSTDGETFSTVKPSGRYGTFVGLGKPKGNVLYLRLVEKDGSELSYAGPVDFGQFRRSELKQETQGIMKVVCREISGRIEDGHPRGTEVRCELRTDDGWGGRRGLLTLDRVEPALKHLLFGCSQERMDQRKTVDDLRKEAIEPDNVPVTFLVQSTCDTVYYQLAFDDGSTSEPTAAPVLSE